MWRFIAGWLACPLEMVPFKDHPSTRGRLTGLRNKPQQKQLGYNFQHWYLADMLASVYSYRVMVKSISSCCVCGRWVLSNPVTYVDLIMTSNLRTNW